MSTFDPSAFQLRLSTSLRSDFFADQPLDRYEAALIYDALDGPELKSPPVAAKLDIYALGLNRAATTGRSFADIADEFDTDLYEVVSAVFDGYEVLDELEADLEFGVSNFLVVNRAWVAPEFRGAGLGRMAVALAVKLLGTFDAVFLEPCPTERTDGVAGNPDTAYHEMARPALIRTWESLGFFQLTERVWALDLRFEQPALDAFARGECAVEVAAT